MAKKKTSTGLEVNYVRTDEKKLKKTISMADVRKDEGAVRTMEWKKEAFASLPASDSTRSVADRASYYLSARNTDNKMPTVGERLGYGAKSILERTKATPDLLWETGKAAVSDFKANRENEAYQAAKDKREELERDYRNAEYLERLGVETPDKQILEDAIAKILEEEERLKQTTQLDPDSYGMQTYAKGVEAEQKALAGLHPAVQEVGGWTLGVADYLSTAPLGLIPVVGKPAALGVMGAKAAAGKSYELSQEGTSPTEAVTRGLVSGAIEVATEMTPLDEIVDLIKFGGKPIVAALLKQAGIEATEEGISYTLNYVADKAAKDPNATFSLSELRSAVLGGAFSGGLLGGGASLVNRAVNRAVNGNTAFMEDNDPRQSLPVVEARQDAPVVAKTDNTEKGVLSDSGGISEEGVKLDSEEEIVAQHPQANSDDAVMEFARETVAKRQEYQQADREAIEYNVRKATGYGEQGVKAVADIVEKTNADTVEIDRAFRTAYETGLTGIERSKVELVNEIQEKAYTAGYLDYTAEMEKVKAKQAMVRKDGGVFPDDKKLYKNLPTQTYNSLNRIGKALGTAIVMDDTLKEHQQGYYNAKDGSIHISTNVGNAVMEVFKHEVTHRMKELAPTEYAAFRSFVYESLNEGRMSSATLAEAKRAQYASMGVNEDISGSIDEVVAAFTEELFADEQKLHNFIAEVTGDETKRNWAQKFFDIIREVIDKVKGALRKGDTSVADSIKQLEKAEQMWKDAIKASVKNVQNTQSNQAQKNTADGDVKYSLKMDGENIDVDVQEELKFFDIRNINDYVGVQKQVYKRLQESGWLDGDGKRIVQNEESGITVEIGRKGINETFSVGNRYKNLPTKLKQIKIATVRLLPDIIREGRVIERGVPNAHKDNSSLKYTYLQLPVMIEGETQYVVIDIRQSRQKNMFWMHGVYLNEKSHIHSPNAVETGNGFNEDMTSNTTVSQPTENVKYSLKDSSDRNLTKEQQEFYADSKILDKNGNLLVLYHGTGADFTVFDTKRVGQNYGEWSEYGKGIYLTPSTKLARYYAENARGSKTKTMELYANIENPFNVTKVVEFDIDDLAEKYGLTEFDVSFLKRAGYRLTDFLRDHNEDITAYLTSKGHDGLWDMERGKATQVVAYEANQVKNVDNKNPTSNPDIRFSLKSPREETKNLIALHNLNAAKLKKVLGLGGFPMPSIAVTRTDIPHTNFGDITLIMNKSTVDPKANRKNTVYSADAWTPTVPPISYKPSETRLRDIKKMVYDFIGGYEVADKLDHISFDSGNISNALDRYDGDLATGYKDNSTLQYAFLKANDADFKLPMTEEKLYRYGEVSNEAVKYFAGHVVHGLQTIRQYRQMGGAEMMQNEALLTAVADALNWDVLRELEPDSEAYKQFAKKTLFKADEVSLSQVDAMLAASEKYFNGGVKQTIDSREASKALKRHIADNGLQEQYEAWLTDLFDGVIEKTGIYNNKDIFTPSGNRRTFEQLHMPVTVENIVKAMASQNGGKTKNIAGFNGVKTLRAGMAKRFKNITEMHKLKDRLQNLTEEEFEAIHKELSDRMYDIINRIIETGVESSGNVYIRMDSVGEMLMEIAENGKYTIDSIVTHFETYQYKIGNSLANDIKELLFDVSQMPTNMFEAKPARVVGFDEVLAAIVPDDTEHSLVEKLQAAGVENVMTYKKGDDAERLALANSVEDARFSLKEDKDILKENAKLKEINAALKNQFKVTKFAKVDKKALERFTKQLLKDYSSQADAGETRLMLDGLYQYMASGENGESAVWEDVYKQAREIAEDVLRKSVEVDDEMYREYADLRKYLRETPISISSEDVADIDGVESLQEFRKKYWGRIRISNDGIRIDDIYDELSAEYPALFDAETETHPGAQLARIGQVLDEMRPVEYNPYSSNIGQTADYMAYDIVDRFFELPQAKPTFADKAERKLTETRIREGKKLENLRTQKNERIAQLIAEGRRKIKDAQQKEREKRIKAVDELKDKQKQREKKMSEKRQAAILRKRIEKHTKALSDKLLKPTDKQHIPEALRKTVAALLENINLESQYTIGEDGKRHKNGEGTPVKRSQLFNKLQEEYAKISENGEMVVDPALVGGEGVQSLFTQAMAMGDTKISEMSSSELDILWQVIRAVEHSISTANKVLSNAKYQATSEWANDILAESGTRRAMKGKGMEELRINLENPYTFFSHYGESGKAIFRMLRDAQDKQQMMTNHIAEEVTKVVDDKTVNKLEKDTHEFKTERGDKLTLTTAHVMEVYLLSKREQAQGHLLKGGIVQPAIESKKIKRGTDSILLSFDDLQNIIGKLTQTQRDIADALQKLTGTTLAEYGNEASMKAYGYKKFTGENYWTIKSAKEGIHSNIEKGAGNSRSIKNIGLAKNVMPHASNPLDINGIFKTFASHSADMIDYAAWLCPMEDANRLYNFSFRDEMGNQTGKTMKGLLDRVGGIGAQEYWHNLMEDIQNGIKTKNDTIFAKAFDKLAGNAKAAAVGANIRVIIQQPTAIMRAAMVLSPTDMMKGALTGGGWKTALKHSAIAQRKDAGGFDISSPMGMYETLFDGRTAGRKLNDAMMWGAGKADAVTWGRIWNACEHNVKHNQPELQTGSKEFYKAVDALFTEVIDQSQVVDGILQRSQAMRSSNAVVKQMTSFMGEPTMALNMCIRSYNAWRNQTDKQNRKAAFKKLSRSITVLVITNAFNALAQSFVDAWRDDDEDKGYWSRWYTAFFGITGEEDSAAEKALSVLFQGNLASNINLLNNVPLAKDVVSIMSGYDVTRMDADVMSDVLKAGQKFFDSITTDGKYTKPYGIKELALNVTKACGISALNILRDVWGIARSYAVATDDVMMQYQMEKAILKVGNEKNNSAFVNILYRAYNTNQEMYQAIYDDMVSNGIDADKIATGMESRMKKAQGVKKVSELEERYLSPTQEKEYKQKNKIISNTNLWKSATDGAKNKIEDYLYDIVMDKDSDFVKKVEAAAEADIDDTEYLLYKLALEMYDKPTENGKYGTFTQEEAENAISELDGLTDAQRAYLWQNTNEGWNEKKNPWK